MDFQLCFDLFCKSVVKYNHFSLFSPDLSPSFYPIEKIKLEDEAEDSVTRGMLAGVLRKRSETSEDRCRYVLDDRHLETQSPRELCAARSGFAHVGDERVSISILGPVAWGVESAAGTKPLMWSSQTCQLRNEAKKWYLC